jgi:ribonuclease HII
MGGTMPRRPADPRRDLRARERALRRAGYRRIAGADEAGAGPLAVPLVAAAVILPSDRRFPGIDDSKRLTEEQRERLAARILERAVAHAVAVVPAREVDEVGPYQASLRGMTRALAALDPRADYAIVDARRLPNLACPHEAPIRADGHHRCVAAASIVAKVTRDRIMLDLDARHPGYGFARHKGYATAEHRAALARLGPCEEHRRRYAPVRALLEHRRQGELAFVVRGCEAGGEARHE